MSQKRAYVIATGGDQPYTKGLPMIHQLQPIFNFVGTTFEGYIIGEGNRPDDITQDLKHCLQRNNFEKNYNRYS